MLRITPERCSRITGTACLAAITAPRRLMAQMRSNTASEISASGASPPPMLTPTFVDAPPAASCLGNGRRERALLGDVRLECDAGAAVLGRQSRRLLRGGEVAVDRQHPGALLGEAQHGGAAVAQAFAGALPGPDHDRDLSRKTHGEPPCRAWR